MKVSAARRVLMLLENQPYPQDSRVRREAVALTEADYKVTVIAPGRKAQTWRENVEGVQVYRFPAPSGGDSLLGYLWEYGYSVTATFILSLFIFLREGFDVIHAHNPPDLFVFIAAFYKLFGKRFIYDHHDLAPEMYYARLGGGGNRLIYSTLVALEKLSCRLADHVIVTNESYKTVAVRRGRVPEDRISIVRNGPEERVELSIPAPKLHPEEKITLGYVGVMGFQDGLDYLLRALHHLVFELDRTDFCCVLIGAGDAKVDLEALTTQLELGDYVHFAGWMSFDKLVRELSTADICVVPDPSNPYNDHSTMIKITEYMALDKPIVAFDLPEHRYTAQGAALYAKPNDEFEFAQALVQLMDDPAQRRAMGSLGRRRIESELAWRYSVPHLLNAYHKVLKAPESRYPNDAPEV